MTGTLSKTLSLAAFGIAGAALALQAFAGEVAAALMARMAAS